MSWSSTRNLPPPSGFPWFRFAEPPEPMAQSIHFLQGQGSFIVSYLHHGVVLSIPWHSPCGELSDRLCRCWDRNSLSPIWQITPRSCEMFVSFTSQNLASSFFPSGRSCLLEDQGIIAVTNLFDGVDCYDLTDQSLVYSFKTAIPENVITPVISGRTGSLIIGGSCGTVQVLHPFPAEVIQTLELKREQCYGFLWYSCSSPSKLGRSFRHL